MADLSVVVITKDEEHDLAACLDSVKGLAAEVVVIDNRSTDRTVELAKARGAVVRERVFDDYASQKQFALEQATRGWILSIDADERVTPELARELERLLAAGPAEDAFELPFEVEFMGRVLRFGGLGSERHLRLVRRGKGRFVGGGLHEGLEVDGRVGRAAGRIRHVPYRDLDEYLAKLGRYTSLAAEKRHRAGRRSSPLDHLRPCWELFARLVLKLGLLDGTPGVVYAGLSAFHTWVKYVKLRELEDRS
ncbi:MAG: glycosyltransferase family 2 protein [Elusimicrobia bacterium]|nr:glycosyltransferase family 2 protein [Elusimicrobiota bacterium]